jgi:asparagine synthase (glutamine-hydrolysing)
MVNQGKAGFAIPVGEWFKGTLRSWAEDLLPRSNEYFNASAVQTRWRDHLSGRRDYTEGLWAILMFQAWLSQQEDASVQAA